MNLGRLGWRRVAVLHRLMVNLKSGGAIAGLLMRQAGDVLVFTDAELFEAGRRSAVRMDGEVIIDRNNIAYAQVLPPKMSTPTPAPSTDE